MPPEGVQERLELIVEYMKGSDDVLLLVADAFESLEMRKRAADVCVQILSADREPPAETRNKCGELLERLRQSLSPEDNKEIESRLRLAESDPAADTGDEMKVEDVASEKIVGTEDVVAGSGFGTENAAGGTERDSGGGVVPPQDEEESSAETPETGSRQVTEEVFPPPELDEEDEPAGETFEDFQDIVSESAEEESEGETLAEQITSDIDEGDLKSHYDMGMAYIEMQLFDEAIKELQIAAGADEMKLSSLEMIGLCFISKQEPRLAVKQLERGLAIADSMGKENLGIHYNLGMAYEALGEIEKAREHFEQVYIVDVTFRDIEEKIKKMRTLT
jgi:tetratricopeptide (TPR) repeat protein